MLIFTLIAIILLTLGHLWFSWTLWQADQLFWAVVILLVPFPLLGLIAWWQADWDSSYRPPAFAYFGGYLMAILAGVV